MTALDVTKARGIQWRALLADIEAATGPDAEIDRDLGKMVGWKTFQIDRPPWTVWKAPDGHERFGSPDRWTASLDAVVALVEREMPGAVITLEIHLHQWCFGRISRWDGTQSHNWLGRRQDTRIALALLAALTRARIAELEAAA